MNSKYFLYSLSNIINYYSNIYDNHIVIGDFNLEPSQRYPESFMKTHNYFNLIKSNTCFKKPGSCIDLILANIKYCFQGTSSFETGLSDIIVLFILYLKSHLRKKNLNKLLNYKHFQWKHFENDLKPSLNNCNRNFDEYEKTFTSVFSSHTPKES